MTNNKSYASLLLTIALLMITTLSSKAFAAKYCYTEDGKDEYVVSLGEININPSAQVGDIIAKSDNFERTIKCSRTNALAELKKQNDPLSDITLKVPNQPIIAEQGGLCKVIDSGYPGLGIAWYNYNSRTGRWHCFSNNEQQMRQISTGATLIDIIYLVKTADIDTGTFDFNKTFNIYENSDGVDNGVLYKITLLGNTVINSPVCNATAKQGSGTYQFSTSDALNQSYSSEDRVIDILCTGYIPDGTEVPFKITSQNGVFAQSPDYYATSDDGIGVSIRYKTNSDASEKTLLPNDRVVATIMSNNAEIGLKFIPYIKDNSGIYPISDKSTFNISITPEGD